MAFFAPFHAGSITRQQFIDAIEAGIAASDRLPDNEKMLLRHVGRTAKNTLVARFEGVGPGGQVCGCPLALAGLVAPPEAGSSDYIPEHHRRFYQGFDRALWEHGAGYFEVLG